jgi:hypothetical protein
MFENSIGAISDSRRRVVPPAYVTEPRVPHICPVLADVGYRGSRPANPSRQALSGLKIGPAFRSPEIRGENPRPLGRPSASPGAQKSAERFPRPRTYHAYHAPFCNFRGTRISCHDALERTACAPFREERRMKFTEATKFHGKSGGPGFPARPQTQNYC